MAKLKLLFVATLFLVATIGASAQYSWSGTQNLTDGQVISQDITLTGNVEVNVASGTATISGTISGSFNLEKTGLGTLVLTNSNLYTGSTVITEGNISLGSGGATGDINETSNIAIVRGRPVGQQEFRGGNLIVNRSGSITISKVISNLNTGLQYVLDGSVIKQGTGTLILTANNTYISPTIITAGTLQIGNGGTTGSIPENITVSDGANLVYNRSILNVIDGVISGAGNVTFSGTAINTISNPQTYTGKTTISAGSVIVGGAALANTNEIAITAVGSGFWVSGDEDATYSMPITGQGRFQKDGTATVTLTNPQYIGETQVMGTGTVVISGVSSFPSSFITVSVNATMCFSVASGQTLQYDGEISGAGNLAKKGEGKLILTENNTYEGQTSVHDGGILQIGGYGSINSTSIVNLYESTSGTATTLRFEPAQGTAFSKVINGNGNVEIGGSSYIDFTADHNYNTTIIDGATLYLGYETTSGTVTGDIINNGNLCFNHTSNKGYAGIISGIGNVYKQNTNILILNGENSYTGETVIEGGTLAIGINGSIASSQNVRLNSSNAKFDVSRVNQTIKNLNSNYANAEVILGTRTLYLGTSGQNDGGGSFAGIISGTASTSTTALYKWGAGTLTLSGTSTYSGRTTTRDGVIVFSALNNFGTSNIIFGSGTPTLRWAEGNSADISGRILTLGTPIFDVGNNDVTFATALTETGSVTKTGAGKLTYTAENSYEGGTNINAGTLEIGLTGNIQGNITITSGAILSFARISYTYPGIISGEGNVEINNTTLFTGTNTYTGTTTVNSGILTIGNAATSGSISNESNIILNSPSNSTVAFNRSDTYTYAGIISGTGSVAQMSNTGTLILNGENTYSGLTMIGQTGTLELGANGSINNTLALMFMANGKFKISSDKQIGGLLTIGETLTTAEVELGGILTILDTHSDLAALQTFSGIITGTGGIYKIGNQTLTLNGINTYTGTTTIENGTLKLGANASIAASESVNLTYTTSNEGLLEIVSGNKTFKNLNIGSAANSVDLGATTLQIGTSAATADGGGEIKGGFIGTGGVSKTGMLTLLLNANNNAATGTFSQANGAVEFGGNWAGNYYQAAGTILDIKENANISGNLTLSGGNIAMDLTQTTPSKINVTGTVAASGTTTFSITSGAVTNHVLMQAASGIDNTSNYALDMPGFTASLTANGTQLLLTATVSDNTPPTPGTGINGTVAIETANLTWTVATDDQTPQSNLRYFVYQSTSNNIESVVNCEANGTLLNPGGSLNITNYTATGLMPNTNYYFNVVVADQAGNKAAYTMVQLTTNKAVLSGFVSISGNTIFGETLTAETTDLTSTPIISDLGTLSYQWKRGATNIGTNNSTYILQQEDIGSTITVTVSATNCDGSITSAQTAIIIKADQTPPAAPTLLSKTHNSITLNEITGCEYRIDGGNWQSSNIFTDLQPETDYQFEARKAETDTHFASDASEPVTITTNEVPEQDKILQGVITPTPITGLPNGTPKTVTALGLPNFVTLITDQGNVPATVNWDVEGCSYNPELTIEQTFIVDGTFILPEGVANPDGLPLTVSISVTVEAAPLNPQIVSVTISPKTVILQKGTTFLFNVDITAIDGADESVEWSLTGNISAQTVISSAGLLTIDENEDAETLTVTVTSLFDSTKFDTAIVTVTDEEVPQIISVTISPKSATLEKGETLQFEVEVVAINGADESVSWIVEENVSAQTFINNYGLLTVGIDETSVILKVTVFSIFDNNITDQATVYVSSGINKTTLSELVIYPNPTTGKFSVFSEQFSENDVDIYDISGRKLSTFKLDKLSTEIDISHLPNGIYFVKVGSEMVRIVKN